MSARVRTRAALCLALALANSGPAVADSRVYRWLDDEGKVHITATPPPDGALPAPAPERPTAPPAERDRFQVVPETGAASAAPSAPEDAAVPEAKPPAPSAPPAAAAPETDSCLKYEKEISAWLDARRKVTRLEAQIERIESNPVQASATESCPRYNSNPCHFEAYSRDEALRRANDDLSAAEDRVGDVEEAAHKAGVPDRCLVDPRE